VKEHQSKNHQKRREKGDKDLNKVQTIKKEKITTHRGGNEKKGKGKNKPNPSENRKGDVGVGNQQHGHEKRNWELQE